jgi:hypothetical protein
MHIPISIISSATFLVIPSLSCSLNRSKYIILITCHGHNIYAVEQHIDNHGRVGVHQGAEAEGGEAEPGDCLRARRAETQVVVLSDGIQNLNHIYRIYISYIYHVRRGTVLDIHIRGTYRYTQYVDIW